MAESPDVVQFGCIRCKRTARSEAADEAAEQIMLQVFEAAYALIKDHGEKEGILVDDSLKTKLLKWGIKQSILPAGADKRQKLIQKGNVDI
jgi:hypothetical protein